MNDAEISTIWFVLIFLLTAIVIRGIVTFVYAENPARRDRVELIFWCCGDAIAGMWLLYLSLFDSVGIWKSAYLYFGCAVLCYAGWRAVTIYKARKIAV